MIQDKDIVFVTTALYTKWLGYQSDLIKRYFPESEQVIMDGRTGWPNSWFYWISKISGRSEKWYIHIDEDFFIESRDEIINLLEKMDSSGYDLSGISEAYCHYRGNNPVALNSFFMVGRVEHLKFFDIDPNSISFTYNDSGYSNNMGLYHKDEYMEDYVYPHEKAIDKVWHQKEAEPYYLFMWIMKNNGLKFYYLYPEFDRRFMSTNPRIEKDSPDIGIHMWYTRIWESPMDVHGMKNSDRYFLIEEHLRNNGTNVNI
jgi:hypothetical protein